MINTASGSGSVTISFYNDSGNLVEIPFNWAVTQRSTLVLDQQGIQGLVVSADGNTLSFPISSQVAQSLAPGSVLALGITPATPYGILRKVVSVSQSGSQIVATTTQATLAEVFQQANFIFKTTLSAQSVQSTKALRPGVTVLLGDGQEGPEKAAAVQDSLQDPCTGASSIFVKMFDTPIVQDQKGSITVSGQIEICPSLEFDWNIGWLPPKLNSLLATVTLGEDTHVNITGAYDKSFDKQAAIAKITFEPIPVDLGGVPIVLTPIVTFFIGASGEINAGLSVGVTQTASLTGGLSYSNGQLSRVFKPAINFAQDPIGLDANLSAKGYAGVKIELNVDGVLSPAFSPDAYLELDVNLLNNPWWTLSAGLEGSASVDVSLFGIADLYKFDFPDLFKIPLKTIAQASGGFVPSSAAPVLSTVTPNMAPVGSPSLTLTGTGSNFVPGATVKFNGMPLSTSFVSPNQVTAMLPASNLSVPGTFPITVTNPDASGAISQSVNFTVQSSPNPQPMITSLSPSSATVGLSALTLTINGSGFIAFSSATFNGVLHTPSFISSSQLTVTLTASDLAAPGTFPVVVTNPTPGGGTSNSINFTVQPSVSTLTLQGLTLSTTSVAGGGSVTGTVTLSGAAPTGGVQVSLSSSNSTVHVPATVSIASGQSTGTFTATTTPVSSAQTAMITATLGTAQKSTTLTITPPIPPQWQAVDIYGTVTLDGKTVHLDISMAPFLDLLIRA